MLEELHLDQSLGSDEGMREEDIKWSEEALHSIRQLKSICCQRGVVLLNAPELREVAVGWGEEGVDWDWLSKKFGT